VAEAPDEVTPEVLGLAKAAAAIVRSLNAPA
jgi:hypothetical protein